MGSVTLSVGLKALRAQRIRTKTRTPESGHVPLLGEKGNISWPPFTIEEGTGTVFASSERAGLIQSLNKHSGEYGWMQRLCEPEIAQGRDEI